MSIPGFGGPAEPDAGQQTTGPPQRVVLHSVQAGLKVPSRWRDVSGVPHSGGVALAMLAILPERGGYRGRVAEALLTRYDLLGQAVVFFRFLAGPPGFAGQAASVAGAI